MRIRIKEIRLNRGFSQEEFGKRLGVTKSTISNIETGRFNLTDSMVKLICKEFNIDENWLRTGEGNMEPTVSQAEAYRRAADAVASGSHEMDRIVRGIITYYGNMDDDCKNLFWDYLQKVSSLVSDSESKHTAPDEETLEKQYETKDVHDNAV